VNGKRLRQPVLITGSVALLALSCAASTTPLWPVAMPAMTVAAAVVGYLIGRSWRWVAIGLASGVAVEAALMVLGAADGPDFLWWSLPGFAGGIALRQRRDVADELADRVLEIDAEQELFTELSVRNERARISAELHDIIGHAISVMVVQAAAGQRLADANPELASQALSSIAESARQGRDDLRRLVDVLGGREVANPDLSVVEVIAQYAALAGLDVSCRFEGDRDGVPAPVAQAAVRIVQEGITNALRHAPGAPVDVLVRGEAQRRGLTLQVTNGPAGQEVARPVVGTGNGLRGVRERVDAIGGSMSAGPTVGGGWRLTARLAVS
jgi:signal transduction histidine kinase